jgi:hypothetical protein
LVWCRGDTIAVPAFDYWRKFRGDVMKCTGFGSSAHY